MATVADILKKKGNTVYSVGCSEPVLDAARVMNERHIGALVVIRDGKVVGIFTERDILTRVVAQEKEPSKIHVEEVMSSPVACCTSETPRAECRRVMRTRRIRHLPVVDDGQLKGIVSIGDLVEDSEADQQETIQYLYEYMAVDWKDNDGDD